jgi:asparagine synthase (glutamine-hydrolysing)
VARTRELLEASAVARTWTEVPVACLASGGTDSLITLYLLLKHGKFDRPLPIYTFHCEDLPDGPDSDLYHAKQVAKFFGDKVEHRIVMATADDIIQTIPEVVHALEDKRGRDFNVFTAIYNRFLAEVMARDGIKIAYEGEGPDEALGSYSPWRSAQISNDEIANPKVRKKMVSNLHKGVLLRTSKVMMYFGPLECRSYFLDREVQTFLSSLPAEIVRRGGRRKGVLIDAFKDVIPQDLLERPKARPQDATGITSILNGLPPEQLNFVEIFDEYLAQIRELKYRSWRQPTSWFPAPP